MGWSLKGRCECLFSSNVLFHLYSCSYVDCKRFTEISTPSPLYTPYSPFFPLPVCTVDGVFFHNTFTPNHHNSSCQVFQ